MSARDGLTRELTTLAMTREPSLALCKTYLIGSPLDSPRPCACVGRRLACTTCAAGRAWRKPRLSPSVAVLASGAGAGRVNVARDRPGRAGATRKPRMSAHEGLPESLTKVKRICVEKSDSGLTPAAHWLCGTRAENLAELHVPSLTTRRRLAVRLIWSSALSRFKPGSRIAPDAVSGRAQPVRRTVRRLQ